MCNTCWVALERNHERLGGGLWFTNDLVMTAAHVLGDDPREGDTLELHTAKAVIRDDAVEPIFDGTVDEVLRGKVIELPGGDIALIEVSLPGEPIRGVPLIGQARWNVPWYSTYRPDMEDGVLTGRVSRPSELKWVSDLVISVIQLDCREHHDSYAGYSGSPVERPRPQSVLGILVEQQPKRGNPRKSSNTLFAVSVPEALGRFQKMTHRAILEDLVPGVFKSLSGVESKVLRELQDDLGKGDLVSAHHVNSIDAPVSERDVGLPELSTAEESDAEQPDAEDSVADDSEEDDD